MRSSSNMLLRHEKVRLQHRRDRTVVLRIALRNIQSGAARRYNRIPLADVRAHPPDIDQLTGAPVFLPPQERDSPYLYAVQRIQLPARHILKNHATIHPKTGSASPGNQRQNLPHYRHYLPAILVYRKNSELKSS